MVLCKEKILCGLPHSNLANLKGFVPNPFLTRKRELEKLLGVKRDKEHLFRILRDVKSVIDRMATVNGRITEAAQTQINWKYII